MLGLIIFIGVLSGLGILLSIYLGILEFISKRRKK